ncbi:unnamed protein product [Cuscuta europaea]|uniref:Saposin B-type domain-containing protein n=1 Tax=Cuscuta europaea TaxID=41803 RepID=A0A9P0ZTG4_CUSEU|nr:unnamed protein product [Cuscuta europaea]
MRTSKIYFTFLLIVTISNMRFSIGIIDEEDPGVLDYVLKFYPDKQPPCSECRKHVLALIQQDGERTTDKTPSRLCCSQFIEWGFECYALWAASDNHMDYPEFGDSMEVLDNINNIWDRCVNLIKDD